MELLGLRILLVEDDGMIAMLAKRMLASMGCDVVGVAARLKDAFSKIDTLTFDLALLDVNLAGTLSYPLAERLRARGNRFIFATGYGTDSMPPGMRDIPVLAKPYVLSQLRAAVLAVPTGGMSAA